MTRGDFLIENQKVLKQFAYAGAVPSGLAKQLAIYQDFKDEAAKGQELMVIYQHLSEKHKISVKNIRKHVKTYSESFCLPDRLQ